MSFLSVSNDGYLMAEKSQQAYINEAMRAYDDAYKEISNLLKEQYAKLAGVKPDRYYTEMVKYERLKKLLASITSEYNAVARTAGKATKAGLKNVMEENYQSQTFLAQWVSDSKVIPLDKNLLEYSVTGNINVCKKIQTDAFERVWGSAGLYSPQAGTLTSLLNKSRVQELDRILQTVQNGFITGKSYREQAKAIKEIIGEYSKKAGKELASGAKYNALRIARTEGQRVLNAGALANAHYVESQGIPVKKMWSATLDARTRSSHQSLDGQKRDIDKPFSSPTGATGQAPGQMSSAGENISCRCNAITLVNGVEPEERRGRDPITGQTSVFSYVNYPEWLAQANI
jgi:hypothetical protein